MHKRLARALPILLALAPWPALADVTATYKAGVDRLIVEVADNGDARVQMADVLFVRHGGEDYVTFGTFGGMKISAAATTCSNSPACCSTPIQTHGRHPHPLPRRRTSNLSAMSRSLD
ncbi:hypothetical protein [Sphingomonas sp. 22176]|uniref:hypothetical protein n=1 Tax=Sphingomonas sp. 22176 TaxID=3453884 RepID=UPI003F82585C